MHLEGAYCFWSVCMFVCLQNFDHNTEDLSLQPPVSQVITLMTQQIHFEDTGSKVSGPPPTPCGHGIHLIVTLGFHFSILYKHFLILLFKLTKVIILFAFLFLFFLFFFFTFLFPYPSFEVTCLES